MNNQQNSSLKGNILVVDDTLANVRLLVEILTNQGYTVRPARDGLQALSTAQSVPIDLILLDINMPQMDGYEVCSKLKTDERTREIPIIFISALND
ncbi:MAG: response regulator, partial [Microcoleus sp. SIO2G3]|nr:response regulator [Microcoleus sp. SIO2G3]